jgi:hypothetical protein
LRLWRRLFALVTELDHFQLCFTPISPAVLIESSLARDNDQLSVFLDSPHLLDCFITFTASNELFIVTMNSAGKEAHVKQTLRREHIGLMNIDWIFSSPQPLIETCFGGET